MADLRVFFLGVTKKNDKQSLDMMKCAKRKRNVLISINQHPLRNDVLMNFMIEN